MKSLLTALGGALILAVGLGACKTTEENYRNAYDRALAGRAQRDSLENTIYGAHRRGMGSTLAVQGSDTVEMKTVQVKITEGGGGIPEWLKPYNLVAGQMKQQFNALSLRERLVEAGYPRAFVVETAEPYYYIILGSYPTEAEAVAGARTLREDKNFPVPLRAPLPFILKAAGIR